jgi:branched-chain amino acid transport system ATP-binding protein
MKNSPLSGTVSEIIDVPQRLQRLGRLTTVLVEQNLDFIAALSQRVLIIQKGRITRQVSQRELEDLRLVGEFVGVAQ